MNWLLWTKLGCCFGIVLSQALGGLGPLLFADQMRRQVKYVSISIEFMNSILGGAFLCFAFLHLYLDARHYGKVTYEYHHKDPHEKRSQQEGFKYTCPTFFYRLQGRARSAKSSADSKSSVETVTQPKVFSSRSSEENLVKSSRLSEETQNVSRNSQSIEKDCEAIGHDGHGNGENGHSQHENQRYSHEHEDRGHDSIRHDDPKRGHSHEHEDQGHNMKGRGGLEGHEGHEGHDDPGGHEGHEDHDDPEGHEGHGHSHNHSIDHGHLHGHSHGFTHWSVLTVCSTIILNYLLDSIAQSYVDERIGPREEDIRTVATEYTRRRTLLEDEIKTRGGKLRVEVEPSESKKTSQRTRSPESTKSPKLKDDAKTSSVSKRRTRSKSPKIEAKGDVSLPMDSSAVGQKTGKLRPQDLSKIGKSVKKEPTVVLQDTSFKKETVVNSSFSKTSKAATTITKEKPNDDLSRNQKSSAGKDSPTQISSTKAKPTSSSPKRKRSPKDLSEEGPGSFDVKFPFEWTPPSPRSPTSLATDPEGNNRLLQNPFADCSVRRVFRCFLDVVVVMSLSVPEILMGLVVGLARSHGIAVLSTVLISGYQFVLALGSCMEVIRAHHSWISALGFIFPYSCLNVLAIGLGTLIEAHATKSPSEIGTYTFFYSSATGAVVYSVFFELLRREEHNHTHRCRLRNVGFVVGILVGFLAAFSALALIEHRFHRDHEAILQATFGRESCSFAEWDRYA